jgi:NAD(P)-dependent dehydrogenase (short-subunit alcohol dehydrogenase family)
MRVMVIGATGTIGKAVAADLASDHEVVAVGHKSGALTVDLFSPESIRKLYDAAGPVDAVVSCAGQARFGPLAELSDDDFEFCLHHKLMGQVNLVRLGRERVRDGGSFTLTSGVLSTEPMVGSAAISLVNSGLEGFVRAAALDLPRGLRVNVVSPPWVAETLKAMGKDESHGLPAAKVAAAYRASATGRETGKVLDARRF